MEMKEIIKYVAIAGAVYLVYTYVIAPMMTPTAASAAPPAPGTTPTNGLIPPSTITPTCPTGYTGTYPNCVAPQSAPPPPPPPLAVNNTFGSSDYGSAAWISRVAGAMTNAAGLSPAGNAGTNADNWSYYYQNSASGSPISPALFQGVLDQASNTTGATWDRGNPMSAAQFLNWLVAAKATGLSGMGDFVYTGAGLGSFWRM